MWAAPVVFGAGGLVVTLKTVTAATEKIEAKVEAHVSASGHAGQEERMRSLQETLKRQEAMQRDLAVEMKRVSENVIALCQASKVNCPRR